MSIPHGIRIKKAFKIAKNENGVLHLIADGLEYCTNRDSPANLEWKYRWRCKKYKNS